MLKPGGELDLALEPLGAERGGELGVQHLERHRAVVPEVVGEVHRGHAAPAELALDPVSPGQMRLQRLQLGHVTSDVGDVQQDTPADPVRLPSDPTEAPPRA